MDYSADYWIDHLQLQGHVEGGYFKEVYRSPEQIPASGLPSRFKDSRNFGTSIYFLLKTGQFSALHRIHADETWHFYAGSPLHLHLISPEGVHQEIKVGNNPTTDCIFQFTVKAGYWFGGRVETPDSYALTGCTVSPGFDFADFELADRAKLLIEYPHLKDLILSLTY